MNQNISTQKLTNLYSNAAINPSEKAERYWEIIPQSLSQIPDLARKKRTKWTDSGISDNLESFMKILITTHKKINTLTPDLKRNLDQISCNGGLIEVAHQVLFLGGQPFLFNKVSFADYISKLGKKDSVKLFPFFYIADYDVLQNELLINRIPSVNSHQGIIFKMPVKGLAMNFSQVSALASPSFNYFLLFRKQVMKVYRNLLRTTSMNAEQRQLFEERIENCLDLIEESSLRQEEFTFWIVDIWSSILNLRNKLETPMFLASTPEFRKLLQPGFEFLLKNRDSFIQTLNRIREELEQQGFSPRIPYRTTDFVPFFYECPRCKKARPRISLSANEAYSNVNLSGNCHICKEEYSFSFSKANPDLTEIITFLSPRVDTRAPILSTTLPITVHVGGPGENEYYAQVIPAMRKIGLDPPIFVKYTRIYYNTPWNEALSTKIIHDNLPIIQTPELFNHLADYAKSRKREEILTHTNWFKNHLQNVFESISTKEQELAKQYSIKSEKTIDIRDSLNIQRSYMSHAFGRISQEKSIQENSFLWIDFALLTGIRDISGTITRQIREEMPPGSTWYVSTQNFG